MNLYLLQKYDAGDGIPRQKEGPKHIDHPKYKAHCARLFGFARDDEPSGAAIELSNYLLS